MGQIFNILIAGVGGQGVVRVGNVLREYGLRSPIIQNVVGMEKRGVAQREGMVTATARYFLERGIDSENLNYNVDDLISPLIPMNDAHLVLGLEPLETIRNLKYISNQTVVILNTHIHYPRNVIIGAEKDKTYPSIEEILSYINKFTKRVISMDFNELSKSKLNHSIYSNSIILGKGIKEFPNVFDISLMSKLLQDSFKPPEKNLEAFNIGLDL